MSAELERQLLGILKEAIEKEKDSQKHFQRGASLSTHSEIQEVFLRLMAEEKQHERLLMGCYVEV
jgi:rubrerythrin